MCTHPRPLTFFFFSSRRRHTRCGRDWSSDVCSSDLRSAAYTSMGGSIPVVADLAARGIPTIVSGFALAEDDKIGRASCRERGWISVVDGSGEKKDRREIASRRVNNDDREICSLMKER